MRRNNIYKSAIVGLLEELTAIISGFILPRMILVHFGSEYNGIIASATQFIGCIALLRSGIGMATKAALYAPLHNHEKAAVNAIMSASMKFLRRVSYIFAVGIIVFACLYPFCIKEDFSWGFTASLVLIIGLGTFFQYCFGLGNQLLLEADQKYYIVSAITIVNTLFNTIIAVICMKSGMSMHGVKLCSSVVYCITPVCLHFYVNRKYGLDRKAVPDWKRISKRWDAFGMQLANFVNSNTDLIVASLFLNMREVSVYTVYYLAINGIRKIITRISTGVEAALGNLRAERDGEKLKESFLHFEFVLNFICSFMFSCLIVLIVPFVGVYTKGIADANYARHVFAIVACFAELFDCLKLAYTFMVQATGAFSETKGFFYMEAAINIAASVILVKLMGLVGIVAGTLLAMIYRTIVLARFVYNDVLRLPLSLFCRRLITTVGCVLINVCIGLPVIFRLQMDRYGQWFDIAVPVAAAALTITTLLHLASDCALLKRTAAILMGRTKK
ncbi:MAG: lipopolysaccharide biosynthesis protein [Aristaeellaceae bacterium]